MTPRSLSRALDAEHHRTPSNPHYEHGLVFGARGCLTVDRARDLNPAVPSLPTAYPEASSSFRHPFPPLPKEEGYQRHGSHRVGPPQSRDCIKAQACEEGKVLKVAHQGSDGFCP